MRKILINVIAFLPLCLISQTSFPGQNDFAWPDAFVDYGSIPDSLKNEDAVVLREQLDITEEFIKRRVVVKILNNFGGNAFRTLQLPENFDLTNYPNKNKQGRFKDRKDPFIYSYKIQYFDARIIKPNKRIVELPFKVTVSKVYWLAGDGQRIYDQLYNFDLSSIEPGDILEYTYKANVDWNYSQAAIYPQSNYPKLDYNLNITTKSPAEFKNIDLIYNTNIPESFVKVESEYKGTENIKKYHYHYDFLKGVNYPEHVNPGFNLPNASINHSLFWAPSTSSRSSNMQNYVAVDFYKWALFVDTVKTALFDKYHANIRKFLSRFPEDKTDSSGNVFVCKLIDTLNSFKYISAENLKYGEYAQYSLSSSEYLLKGKLIEEFGFKNYGDFLSEGGVFHFIGVVIDKRRSIINTNYRNHSFLEQKIIVVPEKKSFKYYVPRFNGVKYFPDEMPFYFEATKCALRPCMNCAGNEKNQNLLFISTPKSNFNQNTRVENGFFKVSSDSFMVRASIKENLSGQFSTILRHFYNKEIIDSTIDLVYLKKCTDKPSSKFTNIKLTSSSKLFPYKHSYTCSEVVLLASKSELSLKNWFSFVMNNEQIKKIPNHNYNFDFAFTDAYNYLFEFDKPTEINNSESLSKKLSNDYFEINSNIVKQEDSKYLLSVIVKVKQNMIPEVDASKIIEFVNMLDEINNCKLELKN